MKSRLAKLVLFALAAHCTRPDDQVTTVYAPYAGPPAYPNLRPKIALPAGDFGMVANSGSDSVTAIDLGAARALGSAPVGRDPVSNDGPHEVVGDRAGGFVYAVLAYPAPLATGGHSHGTGIKNGWVQKLALDDLRVTGEIQIDPNPADLALSEDGSRLVVTHFDLKAALSEGGIDQKRANISVIDPSAITTDSGEPLRLQICVAPHGIALSRPDGAIAFVACYGEDIIAIVDVAHPTHPVLRIPLGYVVGQPGAPVFGPYAVALSPSGHFLAIAALESKEVHLLDTRTNQLTPTPVELRGAPQSVTWSDDERVYVATQVPDAIVLTDPLTGAVLAESPLDGCLLPRDVQIATDRSAIYVVCEGTPASGGTVAVLDPHTLIQRTSIPVGAFPDRLLMMRPQ
jgi:DNA-binding beta-propeller fold protein YncE